MVRNSKEMGHVVGHFVGNRMMLYVMTFRGRDCPWEDSSVELWWVIKMLCGVSYIQSTMLSDQGRYTTIQYNRTPRYYRVFYAIWRCILWNASEYTFFVLTIVMFCSGWQMLKYCTTAKPRTVIMAARQNADEMKNAADSEMIDRHIFIDASWSPNR